MDLDFYKLAREKTRNAEYTHPGSALTYQLASILLVRPSLLIYQRQLNSNPFLQ